MKHLFTTTLLFAIALCSFSQTSNMVFFSEYGERFTLFINSVQQNQTPTANLKLTNMQPSMKYTIRVVFAADSIEQINDAVSLPAAVEKTWKIRPKDTRAANTVNKHLNPKAYANGTLQPVKQPYVVRLQTETPLMNQTMQGNPNQQVINYGDPNQNTNTNSTVGVNTHVNPDPSNQGVNMNVNTNGVNMNVNTSTSTTRNSTRNSSTTTTTTTTNGQNFGQNVTINVPNNGYHGCPAPLTAAQFNIEKNKVAMQKTRAGKLLVAKKLSQNKCLTSQQIYTIAKLIMFESDRLDYAKLAFNRCWDPENYELVYNAFSLSTSVEDLNNYIESTGLADAQMNTNTTVNTNPTNPVDVNININTNTTQQDPYYDPNLNTNTSQNRRNTTVYVPGYSGPTGCPMPMNNNDFQAAKSTISSKSFESTKLDIAKQVLGSNCMTVDQVTEITRLFEFESNRLEFAKFAYSHTYDKGNYFKVNNAFSFESSITELQEYIKGR